MKKIKRRYWNYYIFLVIIICTIVCLNTVSSTDINDSNTDYENELQDNLNLSVDANTTVIHESNPVNTSIRTNAKSAKSSYYIKGSESRLHSTGKNNSGVNDLSEMKANNSSVILKNIVSSADFSDIAVNTDSTDIMKSEKISESEITSRLENSDGSYYLKDSDSGYPGKTVLIDDDNYEEYFNRYTGDLINENSINSGDILKLGNLSNRIFRIHKKLYITSITPEDRIVNGAVFLLNGSDGSTVTKLHIENDQTTINIKNVKVNIPYGIWLNNTNHNIISFNYFNSTECMATFAFYAYNSSYNQIIYNSFHTGNSDRESTSCLVMDVSHYNNISYNNLTTVQSNVIYMNHLGWAGVTDVCYNTLISNNYLHTDIPSPMSYGMQIVYGLHHNTTVVNNTIDNVYDAINLNGDNITISGNRMVNFLESGIQSAGGTGIMIENNTITGTANVILGMQVYGNNVTIRENKLDFYNGTYYGIFTNRNTSCYNNKINLRTYGKGIQCSDNNTVFNNTVKGNADQGIYINGTCNKVYDNIIETNSIGIQIVNPSVRVYNNSILANRIKSDKEGIYVSGLIYNTTIGNNIIETNSTGIYRKVTDAINDNLFDNIINGVITDPTAITVDDTNFYNFFTKDGYLNFTFKEGVNGVIFLSILSNKDIKINKKIYLMSNHVNNYLYNVTVSFIEGSDGSIIKDLNFYNLNNDNGITVINSCNIEISDNNITLINNNTGKLRNTTGILINGVSESLSINNNNIYIETGNNAKGIEIRNPNNSMNIYNNTIIIKTQSEAYGIITDNANNSQIMNNYVNIISDSYNCGLVSSGDNLSLGSNSITLNSRANSTVMILDNITNSNICDNKIDTNSTNCNGILINGLNLTINRNSFKQYVSDDLNNTLINISRSSRNIDIKDNTVDTNIKNIINRYRYAVKINVNGTRYIIGNENYRNYFTEDNILNDVIKSGDILIFKNLTEMERFTVNTPVNITSFSKDSYVSGIIVFNKNSSNTNISDLIFNDAQIILDNTENITLYNSIFRIINNTSDTEVIVVNSGLNNEIKSNNIIINNSDNVKFITVNGSDSTVIDNNYINSNNCSELIFVENRNSDNTDISYNDIKGEVNLIRLIESYNSSNTVFSSNNIRVSTYRGYIYYAENTDNESISKNNVYLSYNSTLNIDDEHTGNLKASNQTIIYCINIDSLDIEDNHFESINFTGDYCVIINSNSSNTYVINNYLVSDNSTKAANLAVFHFNSNVYNNMPCEIYISTEGNDEHGDGTKEKPYRTLKYGISKALGNSTVYLSEGTYEASSIILDKSLRIIGDNSIINLNRNRLFTVSKDCNLEIYNTSFTNGNSINGTVFLNFGNLLLVNSVFKDNTALNANKTEVSGLGAVSTNYGSLSIVNCSFINNTAHKGGVIMNYGDLLINNSYFVNNSAVEGSAIHNSNICNIYNSVFSSNHGITKTDYCIVKTVNRQLESVCCNLGSGGAIYGTSDSGLKVDSCEFSNNTAVSGGAIFVNGNLGKPDNSTLIISNSSFNRNNASSNGGAVYAKVNELAIRASDFTFNEAGGSGGGLSISSNRGIIDSSVIGNNTAGTGGGIDASGNITITNTFISNNNGQNGGAVNYNGGTTYGHYTNHINIYNSTISNNRGLDRGGAFQINNAHMTISESNIVNNFAPENPTVHTNNRNNLFDVDNHNWWGSNSGPDDSVWRTGNLDKRNWAKSEIKWYSGQNKNNNKPVQPSVNPRNNHGNAHMARGTGTSLVPNYNPNGNGNSNPGQNGNENGNGNGNGGNIKGNGGTANQGSGGQSSGGNGNGNGNGYGASGQGSVGLSGSVSSGGSPSSGAGDSDGGSSSSGSEDIGKAFELTMKDLANTKKVDPNTLIWIILLFAILLYVGYKKEKRNDEYK